MTNAPFDAAAPETWEALARYVTGESSSQEAHALRVWLDADPQRSELLETMRQTLDRMAEPAADVDVEAALRAVRARAGMDGPGVVSLPARRRAFSSAALLRAAAVIGLVAGGAVIWRAVDPAAPPLADSAARTYRTEVGRTASLELTDGSRVVLGPSSELHVGAGYGSGARTVTLRGVALFEVTHDDSAPFVVRAGSASVRDLGTVFTVWHDDSAAVRVAVTEGTVVLRAANAADSLLLRAGDRGALEGARAVRVQGEATAADHAWTRGQLVFDAAGMPQVAAELRRWYGLELRFTGDSFAERRLTATFNATEEPRQVLDVIAAALGASFELHADTAVLRSRVP